MKNKIICAALVLMPMMSACTAAVQTGPTQLPGAGGSGNTPIIGGSRPTPALILPGQGTAVRSDRNDTPGPLTTPNAAGRTVTPPTR